MRGWKGLIAGLVVALLLLGLFEFLSPKVVGRNLNSTANDVGYAAAHTLFVERSSQKPFDQVSLDAHAAALAKAKSDGVTLTIWYIDQHQVVHVKVDKEAPSLVLKHFNGKYFQVSRSAVVAPG
jgi:hypothetical protein